MEVLAQSSQSMFLITPTSKPSNSAQVFIRVRMCPEQGSKYQQLMALILAWKLLVEVPSSVNVCQRELRAARSSADRPLWDKVPSRAQSSTDSRPLGSQCTAALCSAAIHQSPNHKHMQFWSRMLQYYRFLREAPVWTVTPCTVVIQLQMRDMGTYQDRAVHRAIKDHPLPPSPYHLQPTKMTG